MLRLSQLCVDKLHLCRRERATLIVQIYEMELVRPYEAERTIKKRDNLYITVYNMEVVLLLAYRLDTYQTRAVRRELMERIGRNHKPFEVILTATTEKRNHRLLQTKYTARQCTTEFSAGAGTDISHKRKIP